MISKGHHASAPVIRDISPVQNHDPWLYKHRPHDLRTFILPLNKQLILLSSSRWRETSAYLFAQMIERKIG